MTKKQVLILVVLACSVFCVLCCGGYIAISEEIATQPTEIRGRRTPTRRKPTPTPQFPTVIYKVTQGCSGGGPADGRKMGVDVTMNTTPGNTIQRELYFWPDKKDDPNAKYPTVWWEWEYKFQAKRGQFLYLSVQNNEPLGWVKCEIYSGGKLIDTALSEGEYVIASCSGKAE